MPASILMRTDHTHGYGQGIHESNESLESNARTKRRYGREQVSGNRLLRRSANFMMQLMVDDLSAWWAHIESLDLPKQFGVPPPKPPALQPWGLVIAYVVDPVGVLWHVAQRREGVVHDR